VKLPTSYDALKTPRKPKGAQERFAELKDEGLRAFVRGLPCLICTAAAKNRPIGVCGPTEVAHVKTKGAAGGDFDNVIPLGQPHHREQHRVGIKSFEYRYGIRLRAAARKVTGLYIAERKHG
jgi:hypothetical protein